MTGYCGHCGQPADHPDTLTAAVAAYRAAHHTQTEAHRKAMAASQAYTDARRAARTAPDRLRHKAHLDADKAKEAMGQAWKRCDRAMHAEWEARDALAAAALECGQLTLDGTAA